MFQLKRGDTFAFIMKLRDENGAPLVMDVANMKSQIRTTSDSLITDLTIVAQEDAPGHYYVSAEDTNDWPLTGSGTAPLVMDVEFDLGGIIRSSETVKIQVRKDVTRSAGN